MADSTTSQSGQNGTQSGDEEQTTISTRSSEELEKRLKETASEAKKYRQTNAELKAQLESFEKEKLEAQGKFQEMAKKEKERADKLEKQLKETSGKYALKTVQAQVKAEAAKLGCIDNDALIALMDVSTLDVSDDFEVDKSSLKEALEKMQKEKAYLFQKQTPGHRDLPPKTDKEMFRGKSIKEMSMAEKLQMFRELELKKGA